MRERTKKPLLIFCIFVLSLAAVLYVFMHGRNGGFRIGKAEPQVIEHDPDTRQLADRLKECYGIAFTQVSEDRADEIWTFRDANGLECHVRRYLDDFGREDGSALELYCDDYYAVLVGESPKMQDLRAEYSISLESTLTGQYDDKLGRGAGWIVRCDHYDELAAIYREMRTAAGTAPQMLYGQIGHWSTLMPYIALMEAQSGERLAYIAATGSGGDFDSTLAEVQDAFAELLYQQNRRSELPDAAIRQCPQGGQYLLKAGNATVPVELGWDRRAHSYYIVMKWMDNDCGEYETPEMFVLLCKALGCNAPKDSYGFQPHENELREIFGITLEINPLTMTGTARCE